jgi:hypothetical protein
MSDGWSSWDPEGLRPPGPRGGDQGPDPEPIVRLVRVGFLLAGMVVAAVVNAGLRAGPGGDASDRAELATSGIAAAVMLALLGWAAWAFRPSRLVLLGKRALDSPDPRERRPRAERARAMGFRGLAMAWATQAMALCFLPALVGLVLEVLHDRTWELLAFAAVSLAAGFLLHVEVTRAVRLAVDDPELREHYG